MRFFSFAELSYSNTAKKYGIINEPNYQERENLRLLVVNVLDPLREALGKPIIVNVAYRNERVNKLVGGVPSSQHREGKAADIRCATIKPHEICAEIIRLKLPFDQMINEFNSWVHVSYNDGKNRHQFMEAYKLNGITKYRNLSNV